MKQFGSMNATIVLALSIASVIAFRSAAIGAEAQPTHDQLQSRRTAELNQLGILEYCQAQGMVDEKSVAAQREMIRSQSPMADESPDEAAGRAGFLSYGDRQGRFAESAMAQGITLRTACEIRAALVPTRSYR